MSLTLGRAWSPVRVGDMGNVGAIVS
jgi:hypothetical protein